MEPTPPTSIDSLPSHFDSAAAEKLCARRWAAEGIYRYDPSRSREETFVVDTPPPTVSGSLHVGHVFSYAHADMIVRYQRMRGKNIFYPMGWDDNGLPTERRVQNYFHVRVDVSKPYEPGLQLEAADPAQIKREPPRLVSRPNFIELCDRLTRVDEEAFKELWQRIGLSVDWEQEYATIGQRSRLAAQRSFLECRDSSDVYNLEAPTQWDVDFQTAVAQAEVEERPTAGHFHDIAFGVEGSREGFVIATTRPELLAACVGITAHPDDPRYRHLFGSRAVTPVFRVSVPIFPSTLVDPEKGSGILMVCTFGDATDVTWWREQKLPLRAILGKDGRLLPIAFGTPGWESADPDAANTAYAKVQGKRVGGARAAMVELLQDPMNAAVPGAGAPLSSPPTPIQRAVKYFEKGDLPLEIVTTRQWFVRLLDKKERLLELGDRIQWHPAFMATRYRNWTQGLQFDWCVSRQRFFGVPIPVWYPLDDHGNADYDHPIWPKPQQLPVDPTSDVPEGYTESQRNQPNGFLGEADVFDTWFTSSLTPQIGSHWGVDPERHRQLFPGDMRPQSHEIIRTWTFYTIAKGLLHEGTLPWHHVVVSGWVLDPDRKKMSKSKGNVITPVKLVDTYGADAVRYWAGSARLGTDTAFDEKILKVGRRLVTKLFNAAKYVLAQLGETSVITEEIDRDFVALLRNLVSDATRAFERFEYAEALAVTERFFWSVLTDSYLEIVKGRARGEASATTASRGSATVTLRLGLSVIVRLLAPHLPFITEEIWSWEFARRSGHASVHRAPWPTLQELAGVAEPTRPGVLEATQAAFAAVNKRKSELGASVGRPAASIVARASAATRDALAPAFADLQWASRSAEWRWVEPAPDAQEDLQIVEMKLEGQAESTSSQGSDKT